MKKYHHDDDKIVAILCTILILLFIDLYYCSALKDCYGRNHIYDKINEETNVEEKEELHE